MTARMGAEPIDFAPVKAEHEGRHWCSHLFYDGTEACEPCLTYRLAVEAERLAGKVARVEAQRDDWRERSSDDYVGRPLVDAPADVRRYYRSVLAAAADRLDTALADQPEQVQPNLDFLDFPTAWAIQKRGLVHASPRCSAVQTGGALLCDCGAVTRRWQELRSGVVQP